jgi:phosphoglycolate phosphatase-like HAD superfamily hydrolase
LHSLIDGFLFSVQDVRDTLLDANRKGIKRAQDALTALRERYREEQLKEMEDHAAKKKAAAALAAQLAQEREQAARKAKEEAEEAEKRKQQAIKPSDDTVAEMDPSLITDEAVPKQTTAAKAAAAR